MRAPRRFLHWPKGAFVRDTSRTNLPGNHGTGDEAMRRRRGGLLGTAARTAVVAGTVSAVAGKGARKQAAAQRAAGAPNAGASDRISQLERLSKLKKSGALTKEEFAREKAKLLG
jgi:Short C-terminal domain